MSVNLQWRREGVEESLLCMQKVPREPPGTSDRLPAARQCRG